MSERRANRMRILCLFHRTPWPPDKGDKLRAWHLLRALAARHALDVGWFVDDPRDRGAEGVVAPMARAHAAIPLARPAALIRGASALAAGGALSVAWYRHPAMRRFVAESLTRGVDAIYAFSAPMAQYALPGGMAVQGTAPPLVADFVDVDSLKWRDYARRRCASPLAPLHALEASRLAAFEGRAARRAGAVLFVSEAEAARFRERHPDLPAGRVAVVENGVDAAFFDPTRVRPAGIGRGPLVVFTGRMDYPPNVDAVRWFVERVWPDLHAARPDLRFAIVGAAPTRTVRRLRCRPGVFVTGRVDDVRPWLARADLAVVPLRIARGVQNKLLEAMAMARPVVASPPAVEGLDARPGEHLLVADDRAGWAHAVLSLLADPARRRRIGTAARAWVVERHDWDAAGRRLLETLAATAGRRAGERGE